MKKQFRTIAMFYLAATLVAQVNADEPLKVDTQGVTAKILYEAPISGV